MEIGRERGEGKSCKDNFSYQKVVEIRRRLKGVLVQMVDPVANSMTVGDWDLDTQSLKKLTSFIEEKMGLRLSTSKVKDLRTILSKLVVLSSSESFDQFYSMLHSFSPKTDLILDRLISSLTTGETYFFRVPSHFKIMKEVLIPEIVSKHREDRKIRIWSAGCSTGEEPYSLAILLAEALPDLARWDVLILGTDINREALDKAKRGVYGRWSFREVPMQIIRKNFIHRDDKYIIKRKFKDMVTFKPLNLVEDIYPSFITNTSEMDLILCRNVTIYFNLEIVKQVISRIYQSLVEDGYLLVGPAEYSAEIYSDFITRVFPDVILYQRKGKRSPLPFPSGTASPPLPTIRLRKSDPAATTHSPHQGQPIKKECDEKRRAEKEETKLFRDAIQFLEKGEYNYSIEKFVEVLKINPHNARAYFLLGRISAQQGNIASAISCLKESLDKDPLLLEAYYLLALLRLEEGKVDEAATLLKKVIYIDTQFVLAYYHLGTIYKKQGRKELAKKMFYNVKELLTNCNLNDRVIKGEDISIGQILSTTEKEIKNLD